MGLQRGRGKPLREGACVYLGGFRVTAGRSIATG